MMCVPSCGSFPFDHCTLAEVAEFEALVAALPVRHLSPREHARLAWLNARARPPLYETMPKGAA